MMNAICNAIQNLRDWILVICEAAKEVLAELGAEKQNASPNLSNLFCDYMNLQKAERRDWSRYGQQKGTADDLKTVSQAVVYLKQHEVFTQEDLDASLTSVQEKASGISKEMKNTSS